MAQRDTSIKTYVGTRVSKKQFKNFLINAKTPEERSAIKKFYLGEPAKFFGKAVEQDDAVTVE